MTKYMTQKNISSEDSPNLGIGTKYTSHRESPLKMSANGKVTEYEGFGYMGQNEMDQTFITAQYARMDKWKPASHQRRNRSMESEEGGIGFLDFNEYLDHKLNIFLNDLHDIKRQLKLLKVRYASPHSFDKYGKFAAALRRKTNSISSNYQIHYRKLFAKERDKEFPPNRSSPNQAQFRKYLNLNQSNIPVHLAKDSNISTLGSNPSPVLKCRYAKTPDPAIHGRFKNYNSPFPIFKRKNSSKTQIQANSPGLYQFNSNKPSISNSTATDYNKFQNKVNNLQPMRRMNRRIRPQSVETSHRLFNPRPNESLPNPGQSQTNIQKTQNHNQSGQTKDEYLCLQMKQKPTQEFSSSSIVENSSPVNNKYNEIKKKNDAVERLKTIYSQKKASIPSRVGEHKSKSTDNINQGKRNKSMIAKCQNETDFSTERPNMIMSEDQSSKAYRVYRIHKTPVLKINTNKKPYSCYSDNKRPSTSPKSGQRKNNAFQNSKTQPTSNNNILSEYRGTTSHRKHRSMNQQKEDAKNQFVFKRKLREILNSFDKIDDSAKGELKLQQDLDFTSDQE